MFDLDDKHKMHQICVEHEAFQRWGHRWLVVLVNGYPLNDWQYERMVKELECVLMGKRIE